MRTVITGSRTLGTERDFAGNLTPLAVKQIAWIHKTLKEYFFRPGRTMVAGGAKGVDKICEDWVREHNAGFIKDADPWFKIDLDIHLAKWDKYGKSAGFKRNLEMLAVGDNVLAFWDGKSRGTRHTIDNALTKGMSTHVFVWRD